MHAPAGTLVRHPKHLKHLLDRLVALGALPWFAPPLLLVALGIKLDDLLSGEGWSSVFYREERISANRRFRLLKFRVLRPSALARLRREGKTTIKGAEHDPQAVSRVGRYLVKYYLDELPQMLHVLAGTMSLVGPRPLWVHDERRVTAFAPYRVKAGLAGTFQLAKGEGDIFDLDMIYLREYAARTQLGLVAYDVSVVLKTLRKMLRGEGL